MLSMAAGSRAGRRSGLGTFRDESCQRRSTPAGAAFLGLDHWASRTLEGAYINWAVGNSILPAVDPDRTHEGIQKVDRTTVRITVRPVNDAPTAENQFLTVTQGRSRIVTLTGGDPETSALQFTLTSLPTKGLLSRLAVVG